MQQTINESFRARRGSSGNRRRERRRFAPQGDGADSPVACERCTTPPTNARRFTIEKRGDTEPGSVAWRVIASNGAIETIGNERRTVNFVSATTYFWRATWGAAGFRLTINANGVTGPNAYDFSRDLLGVYDPNPHIVFLGSPRPRAGSDQSVVGATGRQVWVSRNPRPSFANQ
jgi:hypothetical protein